MRCEKKYNKVELCGSIKTCELTYCKWVTFNCFFPSFRSIFVCSANLINDDGVVSCANFAICVCQKAEHKKKETILYMCVIIITSILKQKSLTCVPCTQPIERLFSFRSDQHPTTVWSKIRNVSLITINSRRGRDYKYFIESNINLLFSFSFRYLWLSSGERERERERTQFAYSQVNMFMHTNLDGLVWISMQAHNK